jgi:DivIVA domain-containing protein
MTEPPLAEIVQKGQGTRFETTRRGYAPAQVDVFLVSIVSAIDALERQLHELRSSGEVVQDPGRIARIVEVAEREVEKMREEAKEEAATTLSEAQGEANRITKDARDNATHAVDEAQAFLDQVDEDTRRISASADERRRQVGEEIQTMQERLLSVAEALDRVLDPDSP